MDGELGHQLTGQTYVVKSRIPVNSAGIVVQRHRQQRRRSGEIHPIDGSPVPEYVAADSRRICYVGIVLPLLAVEIELGGNDWRKRNPHRIQNLVEKVLAFRHRVRCTIDRLGARGKVEVAAKRIDEERVQKRQLDGEGSQTRPGRIRDVPMIDRTANLRGTRTGRHLQAYVHPGHDIVQDRWAGIRSHRDAHAVRIEVDASGVEVIQGEANNIQRCESGEPELHSVNVWRRPIERPSCRLTVTSKRIPSVDHDACQDLSAGAQRFNSPAFDIVDIQQEAGRRIRGRIVFDQQRSGPKAKSTARIRQEELPHGRRRARRRRVWSPGGVESGDRSTNFSQTWIGIVRVAERDPVSRLKLVADIQPFKRNLSSHGLEVEQTFQSSGGVLNGRPHDRIVDDPPERNRACRLTGLAVESDSTLAAVSDQVVFDQDARDEVVHRVQIAPGGRIRQIRSAFPVARLDHDPELAAVQDAVGVDNNLPLLAKQIPIADSRIVEVVGHASHRNGAKQVDSLASENRRAGHVQGGSVVDRLLHPLGHSGGRIVGVEVNRHGFDTAAAALGRIQEFEFLDGQAVAKREGLAVNDIRCPGNDQGDILDVPVVRIEGLVNPRGLERAGGTGEIGVIRPAANLELVFTLHHDRWLDDELLQWRGSEVEGRCRRDRRSIGHHFAPFGEADDDIVDVETFVPVVLAALEPVIAVLILTVAEPLPVGVVALQGTQVVFVHTEAQRSLRGHVVTQHVHQLAHPIIPLDDRVGVLPHQSGAFEVRNRGRTAQRNHVIHDTGRYVQFAIRDGLLDPSEDRGRSDGRVLERAVPYGVVGAGVRARSPHPEGHRLEVASGGNRLDREYRVVDDRVSRITAYQWADGVYLDAIRIVGNREVGAVYVRRATESLVDDGRNNFRHFFFAHVAGDGHSDAGRYLARPAALNVDADSIARDSDALGHVHGSGKEDAVRVAGRVALRNHVQRTGDDGRFQLDRHVGRGIAVRNTNKRGRGRDRRIHAADIEGVIGVFELEPDHVAFPVVDFDPFAVIDGAAGNVR